MENTYHYYAFISYSTADSKWAKWLQHQLSYYHIPSSVKKSKIGITNKIRPVFIYEYDLAGNQLHSAIQQELEASKYLIVICSPNAAKSKYVNGEIETFIQMGRSEYIIPFILDGEVNSSNPSIECFPPALLDMLHSGDKRNELRGINVATNGKHQALVDVVATMLGVRRDVLWNRYKARQIKQRIALATMVIFAMIFELFYWDYTRPTYKYFADYVDIWGVPTGVIPLTEETVAKRKNSYRIEYRRTPFGEPNAYKWRVNKVSYVNSALQTSDINIAEWSDRYPVIKVNYNKETGNVMQLVFCDTKDKIILRHNLTQHNGRPACIADFLAPDMSKGTVYTENILPEFFLLGEIWGRQNKAKIVRYVYERDRNGYIIGQTFHSNNDTEVKHTIVSDVCGIFGRIFTLDSLGRRTSEKFIGYDGKPTITKKGTAEIIYTYDNYGNISKTSYHNLEGNYVLNGLGFAFAIIECDEYGNTIEETFYGTDNKPCLSKLGYAKCRYTYNKKGMLATISYYGIDDKPCLEKLGYVEHRYTYNKKGMQTSVSYYGTDGNLCTNGIAKIRYEYNNKGSVATESYFDCNGNPCLGDNGNAKVLYEYDTEDRIVKYTYFDTEGNLCNITNGYAILRYKYGENGKIEEVAYYDANDSLCNTKIGNGAARLVRKYDTRGNETEEACYDKYNKLCINYNGYAILRCDYDERGIPKERRSYDTNGNPCLGHNGFAKVVYKSDSKGNIFEESYYGIDNEPCLRNNYYAKWTARYDDRGNMIEKAYYGIDGKPCLSSEGCAKWTARYDDRGNEIEESFYGIDGKPCFSNVGCAKWTAKYDDRGNIIEISFYGVDGKLI